ncbi:hypothetical protein NDU88_011466 [Pleurodeles waltl]|uniref:Uncharacterized protein n=1 Tax=Pleurodeles waltl TaxID=8319 RepID=A0AAV7PYX7_PLEWA|nr:hypothetical protein NDU88_011466 [Pleurodeles waltl]
MDLQGEPARYWTAARVVTECCAKGGGGRKCQLEAERGERRGPNPGRRSPERVEQPVGEKRGTQQPMRKRSLTASGREAAKRGTQPPMRKRTLTASGREAAKRRTQPPMRKRSLAASRREAAKRGTQPPMRKRQLREGHSRQ